MDKRGNRYHLPVIGMRIIKSAVGVFLCIVVDAIIRGGKGMVFYAQLSTLWCMQDYVSETKAKAFQRFIGTVLGCAYGLVFLLLQSVTEIHDDGRLRFLWDMFVAVFIVLVLYTTVLLNKKQASYFSCVVFLSIVINHAADLNPYLFVWNRFLDTMTGIVIGVAVNCAEFPRKKNRSILFLSGLDDTLLSPDGSLSAYSRVELNRMIEDGAMFTVSTCRTQAALMEPLRDVRLKLPVIVMDGAALFYLAEKRYERVYVISPEYSHRIGESLQNMGVSFFVNIIVDDSLMIYYSASENLYYNTLIEQLRSSPYRNYVCRPYPKDESVVYFMVIDNTEKIDNLYHAISELSFFHTLKVVKEKADIPGAWMLKIYNHNATKENMMEYLKNGTGINQVVTFGTIPGKYTHCIQPGDFNQVIKIMRQDYEPIRFYKKKDGSGKEA